LSWVLVAHNLESAAKNFNDVKGLVQMLYPSYTRHGSQNTYSGAPVIGMKYINLARSASGGAQGEALAGTISSFTHTPDLEFGVFEETDGVLPKVIRLTCTFNPIHSETLGFNNAGKSISGKEFPYKNFGSKYVPGSPSQVEFDQEYFKGFKDSEDGKIDKAYSDVLQNRAKEILERRYGDSEGFWNKPIFNR
jgi:hypothetical protein